MNGTDFQSCHLLACSKKTPMGDGGAGGDDKMSPKSELFLLEFE